MYKYLYLTKIEWANAWINGGIIPIKLASTYLHHERMGIMTPDENLIYDSNISVPSLEQYGIKIGKGVSDIKFVSPTFNGVRHSDIHIKDYRLEDGLILSFCNRLDDTIAKRLGKECCVRVSGLKKLRKTIDAQLRLKGVMKECSYTESYQRNHFLKSTHDSWQEEYRIFWLYGQSVEVLIPAGHAKLVAVYEPVT